MPIVPLFGHEALLARLEHAAARGALPASLLLHGPAGAGKQRLALQLARTLLCPGGSAACDSCQHCRYAAELVHPDLHWYFPYERKEFDGSVEEMEQFMAGEVQKRVADQGLYARPPGSHGLFVVTVLAVLRRAALSPALARRKVFVIGDAERMVPQESSAEAANAFLKLLEEPPEDTTILLTSSEPGALLPTIRSRVVSVRVPPLPEASVRAFLTHEVVRGHRALRDQRTDDLVQLAAGRPGRLLESEEAGQAATAARRLLEAAESGSRARRLRAAASLGAAGARGSFASLLEHLTVLVHGRVRRAVASGDERRAVALARALVAVEEAKERARGNVSPQLTGTRLLRQLAEAFA